MTETTSAPGAPVPPDAVHDPGPEPLPPAGALADRPSPRGSDRFFGWVAGFGLTRTDGWLGGVCAGIAARLGIDPIIVRGIFAVVALFGLPAFLVYAIAWALLPGASSSGSSGRIHLRELFHGRLDSALLGIALLLLVGLFPVLPWTWGAFWYPSSFVSALPILTPFSVFAMLFTIALVGGVIYLAVRLSNRTSAHAAPSHPVPPGTSTSGSQMASANSDAPGFPTDQAPQSGEGAIAGDAVDPDAAALAIGDDAASGSAPSSAAELAEWRERHALWREQNEAWRRQQHDDGRAAKEQARQERDAAGAAFAAESAERRRVRKATKPRTSFVFVVAAVGATVVAGAVAALSALNDADTAGFAAAIGVLVAALVASLAMITAGLMRRRSGFLAFVTVVLVFVGIVAALISGPRALTFGGGNLGTSTAPQSITQPFGILTMSVGRLSDNENVTAGEISIRKGTGETYIDVYPGTVVELDASIVGGRVEWTRVDDQANITSSGVVDARDGRDGRDHYLWRTQNDSANGDALTTQSVRLDQTGTGSVIILIHER